MNSDLHAFHQAVTEYQSKFRGVGLDEFEVSDPYDLSAELGHTAINCVAAWPDTWPHIGRAGVYALFGEKLQTVYIGKASLRNALESRLGSYFGFEKDRTCRFYNTWKCRPRYLITVAVPEESRFEAPALKEFLIIKLRPSDNKAGILRDEDFA